MSTLLIGYLLHPDDYETLMEKCLVPEDLPQDTFRGMFRMNSLFGLKIWKDARVTKGWPIPVFPNESLEEALAEFSLEEARVKRRLLQTALQGVGSADLQAVALGGSVQQHDQELQPEQPKGQGPGEAG